jgi:hypothetical protein
MFARNYELCTQRSDLSKYPDLDAHKPEYPSTDVPQLNKLVSSACVFLVVLNVSVDVARNLEQTAAS